MIHIINITLLFSMPVQDQFYLFTCYWAFEQSYRKKRNIEFEYRGDTGTYESCKVRC